ncbi:MAG: ISNCY family transposase [Chitinispirillales bacterium]|nr:ISNCY family transposase [Chitinispirillales bacterium]
MGQKEKKSYLESILPRYKASGRRAKKLILDEFCAVCGYNRKYAIRLLNKPAGHIKKTKRGRKSKYNNPLFLEVLNEIFKACDYMCSIRLKAVIAQWLPFYEQKHGVVADETKRLLLSVNRATLDRILKPIRAKHHKGMCGTKPGTLLKNQIPIRTDNWDINSPGYMEADTVAHCGGSTAGEFVWSLTMTDIHTGWTECRAVWNKDAISVREQIKDIELMLPFKLLGFDSDNGSEFINHVLLEYFGNREKPVQFTRSRPNKKNDNAHVEQKNWTHARHLLEYHRIEEPSLLPLINSLYANEWSIYQNLFCPSLKLKHKERFKSKYIKIYDQPKTPYQRLIESNKIRNG